MWELCRISSTEKLLDEKFSVLFKVIKKTRVVALET